MDRLTTLTANERAELEALVDAELAATIARTANFGKKEWEDRNNERIVLIEKDVYEGLTSEETARRQELENAVFSELDRSTPLTFPQVRDTGD